MEPPNFIYYVTSAVALGGLIALYFFGVWLRNHVLPPQGNTPVKRQLAAAIPVGLVTMGVYAKSAFLALLVSSTTLVFDVAIMAGYAIVFGMLSRESLDRLLSLAKAHTPPAP